MINLSDMITQTMHIIKTMKEGDQLVYKTLKKDRQIIIIKNNESYDVLEDGYVQVSFLDLNEKELKKCLKELKKKEFPRSHRIWNQMIKSKH